MQAYTIAAGFLIAVLSAGCASANKAAVEAEETPKPARGKGPIWRMTKTPEPLGAIRMRPSEKRRISLVGALSPDPFIIMGATIEGGTGISVTPDGQAVVVETASAIGGIGIVHVSLSDGRGNSGHVSFPVIAESVPMVDFTYTPPAGKSVKKVTAAGSFNGWNQASHELKRGDDGVFRLTTAIPPGRVTYKLVVDGEWITDPSNPKKEDGGYGNSLLDVAGKTQGVFDVTYLSPQMTGVGTQGSFQAKLPAGSVLDPSLVRVFVNNREMGKPAKSEELSANFGADRGSFRIDVASNRIDLSVPAEEWLESNFVTVVAGTADGLQGVVTAPIAYSAAPRSPRDEVIYFPMTDRFNDGNPELNKPSKDPRIAPLANYKGGDWAGIRAKIEDGYFKRLGISTIWLAPVNKNTPKDQQESVPPGNWFTSYHGYWPISQTETNEQFGSMQDLKDLVKTAHDNDIAVLLDFVANHVHEDHDLLKAHPDWAAPLMLPDGRKNIRLFDEQPLTTWFDTFLPDLDYERVPEAAKSQADNAIWWMRETGADGFRHDAVKHIPVPFWRDLTSKLHQEFALKKGQYVYQVGETISGHSTVAAYLGPDLLPGQFDFPTYFAIQTVLGRGKGGMEDLATAIREAEAYYPPASIMSPLIGNHDVSRFTALADGDLPEGKDEKAIGLSTPPKIDDATTYDKLRLAFAYVLAIPGPATIYYGDEIGLSGAGDPDNRRMMPWTGWDENQTRSFDSTSALIKARRASIALRRGTVMPIFADKEQLLFARVSPEETVLVGLSRLPETGSMTMTIPPTWGKVKGLQPLTPGTPTAAISGGQITIPTTKYGAGYWRVEW